MSDDVAKAAVEVRKYWRDWPQERRDGVRALSSFLADSIEDLAATVEAARRRPAVAVAETSLPRVREYLDRAVAEAVREVAGAVLAVRAYCDELDARVKRCAERSEAACSTCVERERIAREIRALLPDEAVKS